MSDRFYRYQNRCLSHPSKAILIVAAVVATLAVVGPAIAESPASAALDSSRDAALWPFSEYSPWNHPIGSSAQYRVIRAPDFDVRGGVSVNVTRWSHPVFIATHSDPLREIVRHGSKFAELRIHVPAAAQPDPEVDAHLHIINPQRTRVTELYKADVLESGNISAEWVVENDLHGPGVYTRWHGARAYGGSAIGGLIREGELYGEIRHALAVAVYGSALNKNGPDGKPYTWPASKADYGWEKHYATRGNLQMGSLLAIPPDVDLSAIGIGDGPAYEVARALQNYGAYITDAAAANLVIYVEPAAQDDVPPGFDERVAKVITYLQLVANNGPRNIGGGGTPRQPLAPPLK